MDRRTKIAIRSIKAVVAVALAVLAWLDVLAPVFEYLAEAPHPSVTQLFREIVHPKNAVYKEHLFRGWVFIAILFSAIWFLALWLSRALAAYDLSRRSISILDVDLRLEFFEPTLSESLLTRTQQFHANRSGVSAFYFKHNLDSAHGEILPDSFTLESSVESNIITSDKLTKMTKRTIDVVERFDEDLRPSFWLRFMPMSIKAIIVRFGLFSRSMVTRVSEIRHKNEYNGDLAVLSVTSILNPLGRVHIQAIFPEAFAPPLGEFSGFRINENAVSDIKVHKLSTAPAGKVSYSICEKRIFVESLRLQWRNRLPEKKVGANISAGSETIPTQKRVTLRSVLMLLASRSPAARS